MRILTYPAAATLAALFLILPAQAAHYRIHSYGHPYWQGEPTDHRPIWRFGYYQGNDPDPFPKFEAYGARPEGRVYRPKLRSPIDRFHGIALLVARFHEADQMADWSFRGGTEVANLKSVLPMVLDSGLAASDLGFT